MKLAHYTGAFERFAAALPAQERETRTEALQAFSEQGFPHRKIEDWRYTDLSDLAEKAYALPVATASDHAALALPDSNFHLFSNGTGTDAAPAAAISGAVTQLNAAFALKGYSLNVAPGTTLDQVQHVVTLCESEASTGPVMAHLRHRIVLGANARATVVLQHGGLGEYLTTQVTQIELGAGSRLTVYRVQDESAKSHHLAQTDALLGRDSRLDVVSVDLGSGLARHDLNVALAEAGAEVHMRGLYAPAKGAHVDNHTRIEHRAPRCISREFFRGVVGESTKAVFNGKIIVREGAIKTDSEQRVANLLLSPKAEVNAKPELEIYNDDVKCAHGATFGQLDEDAIFYLRARGVDQDAARALLTYSFAREVLDHIAHDELRERVLARMLERLPQSALLGSLL